MAHIFSKMSTMSSTSQLQQIPVMEAELRNREGKLLNM